MFDYYRPAPALKCPVCGHLIDEWQGKNRESALFVWRQGEAHPVGQQMGKISLAEEALRHEWLPEAFEFYSSDCGHWITAHGTTVQGVWSRSQIVEVRDLPSHDIRFQDCKLFRNRRLRRNRPVMY